MTHASSLPSFTPSDRSERLARNVTFPITHMSQVQPVVAMQPGGVAQSVVTQQPGQTVVQTTTTTIQPFQTDQFQRVWSSGLCDCTKDMKICFCALFCGHCLLCKISKRMNEGCCFATWCASTALFGLRVKLRTLHSIKGSLWDDTYISAFCGTCSLCQIARELDHLGYY